MSPERPRRSTEQLRALSVKLGRRLNAVGVDDDERTSPVQALREMRVLSAGAETALQVQREVRNSSQHVYIELSVADLRGAVRLQLQTSPDRSYAGSTRSRMSRPLVLIERASAAQMLFCASLPGPVQV